MSDQRKLMYIVEDDPMHGQMLQDHLNEKYNFEIQLFSTGEDAVEALNTRQPDIMILDYYLNTVKKDARNGAEILKFVKKEFPEMHVIMVSGQDKIEVAIDTMRYGADDYVTKNDSVFVRTEHAIDKIFDNQRLKGEVRKYKSMNNLLIVVMFLIIAITVILSFLGKI